MIPSSELPSMTTTPRKGEKMFGLYFTNGVKGTFGILISKHRSADAASQKGLKLYKLPTQFVVRQITKKYS